MCQANKIFVFFFAVMQNAEHCQRVLQNLCCWGKSDWKLWPCTRVSYNVNISWRVLLVFDCHMLPRRNESLANHHLWHSLRVCDGNLKQMLSVFLLPKSRGVVVKRGWVKYKIWNYDVLVMIDSVNKAQLADLHTKLRITNCTTTSAYTVHLHENAKL